MNLDWFWWVEDLPLAIRMIIGVPLAIVIVLLILVWETIEWAWMRVGGWNLWGPDEQ